MWVGSTLTSLRVRRVQADEGLCAVRESADPPGWTDAAWRSALAVSRVPAALYGSIDQRVLAPHLRR